MPPGMKPFDSLPRVVLLPGLGALCAGKDAHAARIAHDITAQTLAAKARIAAMGTYRGLTEEHLFEVEYFTLQHAKLRTDEPPLGREVAIVTGAAGAIGSAIADGLLANGCHVALTDLAGAALDNLGKELKKKYGERVITASLDVTDPASVTRGFESVIKTWGGVDLVIVNAGVAMVSSLEQMDLTAFQRVERVNTDGTLLLLRESARHFRLQGTGGDIILVSTKNVFMPGAKFGAYSATKAAAHQLARIASQEMAEMGVRVNMVAPGCCLLPRKPPVGPVGGGRPRPHARARSGRKGPGSILPVAQPFEGCGDRRARFARSAVLRHAANTHHRSDHSSGRRPARFDAKVTDAETRNSKIGSRGQFRISIFEFPPFPTFGLFHLLTTAR